MTKNVPSKKNYSVIDNDLSSHFSFNLFANMKRSKHELTTNFVREQNNLQLGANYEFYVEWKRVFRVGSAKRESNY